MQKILQARTKKVYFQFVECSYILFNEQSEKITPLQSIITCQKAAILHSKKEPICGKLSKK